MYKTTHFRICVKLHTLCNIKAVSFTYPLEILHLTEYFYTTRGCDGCDKYEVRAGGDGKDIYKRWKRYIQEHHISDHSWQAFV